MKLLRVDDMPHLPFVRIPQDFFVVLDEPVMLAGMSYPPIDMEWDALYQNQFRSVISLAEDIPEYNPSPLTVTHSVRMQDLADGVIPRNPLMEKKRIYNAVQAAIKALDENSGVIIHCVDGLGRTGIVLGCLLVEMNFPGQDVVDYLDYMNQARGKTGGWPETVWQSRVVLEWGKDIDSDEGIPELGEELSDEDLVPDIDEESSGGGLMPGFDEELPPDLFPPE